MTDYDEAILPVTGSKDNGKRRMGAIPIYLGASLLIIETRNLVLTIMHLAGTRDVALASTRACVVCFVIFLINTSRATFFSPRCRNDAGDN